MKDEEECLNELRNKLKDFGINRHSGIDFERLMIILSFYELKKEVLKDD